MKKNNKNTDTNKPQTVIINPGLCRASFTAFLVVLTITDLRALVICEFKSIKQHNEKLFSKYRERLNNYQQRIQHNEKSTAKLLSNPKIVSGDPTFHRNPRYCCEQTAEGPRGSYRSMPGVRVGYYNMVAQAG